MKLLEEAWQYGKIQGFNSFAKRQTQRPRLIYTMYWEVCVGKWSVPEWDRMCAFSLSGLLNSLVQPTCVLIHTQKYTYLYSIDYYIIQTDNTHRKSQVISWINDHYSYLINFIDQFYFWPFYYSNESTMRCILLFLDYALSSFLYCHYFCNI